MNISKKDQQVLNDFTRTYIDQSYRIDWGCVKYNSNNTVSHEVTKAKACLYLQKAGIPFATEVRLKSGYIADIVCPTHVYPIIEVRHSETEEDTKAKESYRPDELEPFYIESNEDLKESDVL